MRSIKLGEGHLTLFLSTNTALKTGQVNCFGTAIVCLYSFIRKKTSVDKPLLEYMSKKLNTR